jgi:hypothetical protein
MTTAYDAIMEGDEEPLDPLGYNAVIAFTHHVDGTATVEDLNAYRAWITFHRISGASEADLKTSVAVANNMARKLGVE